MDKNDIERYVILLASHQILHQYKGIATKENILRFIDENSYIEITNTDQKLAKGREGQGDLVWEHSLQCKVRAMRDVNYLKEPVTQGCNSNEEISNWVITPTGYNFLLDKSYEYLKLEIQQFYLYKGTPNLMNKIRDYEKLYWRREMCKKKWNRLILGAPGTGKSRKVDIDAKNLCGYDEECYDRVVFYQDYTYSQFVGSYKPSTIYSDELAGKLYTATSSKEPDEKLRKPYIDYKVVPGPFLKMLCKALDKKNKEKKYVLIIEEINRARAAAVFGDIFQLLDRDNNGKSRYGISLSEELMNFVSNAIGENINKVYLPSNLYIWSTMNTSDQNVEPLDSAFKRRWTPEYIGIDDNEDDIKDLKIQLPFISEYQEWENVPMDERKVNWNQLRKLLNGRLKSSIKNIKEDKYIGPFFISKGEIETNDSMTVQEIIKSKLLIYLREDVLKLYSEELFKPEYNKSIYDLLKAYDGKKNIFNIEDENFKQLICKETVEKYKKRMNLKKLL